MNGGDLRTEEGRGNVETSLFEAKTVCAQKREKNRQKDSHHSDAV